MSALIKCSLNGEMNAAFTFIKYGLFDRLTTDGCGCYGTQLKDSRVQKFRQILEGKQL